MRLLIAILVATVIAVLATLAINNGWIKDDPPLFFGSKRNNAPDPTHFLRSDLPTRLTNQVLFRVILYSLYQVLVFVLVGWATGRLFTQFRKIILPFLAVVIIINYILYINAVLRFDENSLGNALSSMLKIMEYLGGVAVASTILGIWAGRSGAMAVERRNRPAR